MSHEGATMAKCMESGQWSHPMPRCLGSCKIPRVENGRIKGKVENQLIASGATVELLCDQRHEANMQTQMQCHNGTWSHVPICSPCKTSADQNTNSAGITHEIYKILLGVRAERAGDIKEARHRDSERAIVLTSRIIHF
ncbi:sushi domain protein [Teladorsagia circumcincta]|uniref:Sushi domain protein n=1 Tax=Teladorsagia circumcincta TaxID=45464 RepID=A0A2G9TJP0_TELCI|nr:sushi domain protein [Teladorsagia circumcincta]